MNNEPRCICSAGLHPVIATDGTPVPCPVCSTVPVLEGLLGAWLRERGWRVVGEAARAEEETA